MRVLMGLSFSQMAASSMGVGKIRGAKTDGGAMDATPCAGAMVSGAFGLARALALALAGAGAGALAFARGLAATLTGAGLSLVVLTLALTDFRVTAGAGTSSGTGTEAVSFFTLRAANFEPSGIWTACGASFRKIVPFFIAVCPG